MNSVRLADRRKGALRLTRSPMKISDGGWTFHPTKKVWTHRGNVERIPAKIREKHGGEAGAKKRPLRTS